MIEGFNGSGALDILNEFQVPDAATVAEGIEILHAVYTYECYEGSAWVVFGDKATGRLYEVYGGHCSCNGLEDQWDPQETSYEAIGMRPAESYMYPNTEAALEAIKASQYGNE